MSNVSVDLAGYATQTYLNNAVSDLVNSAPATLNTLNKLATALGNDANFSTTVTTSLSTKALDTTVVHLAGAEDITGLKTFTNGLTVSGGTITLPANSIATSAINNSSLQYLDATSSIQTQFNNKAGLPSHNTYW